MYKNILVINLMQIGDLMLTTPVFSLLKEKYSGARLTLVSDARFKDLVIKNRHLDECMFMDKRGKDKGLMALLRFSSKIRKKGFDLVINLHRNERASFLAAFSGAKRILGYSKPLFSVFFDEVMENPAVAHHIGRGPWKMLPPYKYVPGWVHQVHSHLVVLKSLGIDGGEGAGLEMYLSDDAVSKIDDLWRESFGSEDKVVGLNIGASWETKRWPAAYFAECADDLLAKGYSLCFLGGNMDETLVHECISLMKEKEHPRLKVFTGKLSLMEVAAVLRRCVLFITTDSGPMHIGVSQNVPIITMFGASPVPGFYPYDAKDVLIRSNVSCSPCGLHQCPKEGTEKLMCMKNISPSLLLEESYKLLAEYGDLPREEIPKPNDHCCKVVTAYTCEYREKVSL